MTKFWTVVCAVIVAVPFFIGAAYEFDRIYHHHMAICHGEPTC